MAVINRGGRWHVQFRYKDPATGQHQRFRRTTGPGTTRREAEALEREWRHEVENPAPPAPTAPTVRSAAFSGFAKHWLDLKRPDWKPSYYDTNETIIRMHLVPAFGDTDLRTITPEMVQTFKAQKSLEVSQKSVNNFLGAFSSLMNAAIDWGYCEHNPAGRVRAFRLARKDLPFYDQAQSDAFLGASLRVAHEWHAFFLCALRTGMRLGEIFALTWDDLDFVKRQVLVRRNWTHGVLVVPKSGKERKVPMSPELLEALKRSRHLKGDLVFSRADGTYLSYENLRSSFYRTQRAAGLPRITPHGMRHSFASQLVMAGVPLKAVQELLGHADINMTLRYAHLAPGATENYVARLDGHAASAGHKLATNQG